MSTLARYNGTVQDNEGRGVPYAKIEVRRNTGGLGLQPLYSDRYGSSTLGNPFSADDNGQFFFHAAGGVYRIRAYTGDSLNPTFEAVWNWEPHGTSSETDIEQLGQYLNAGIIPVLTEAELPLSPGDSGYIGAVVFADPDTSKNGYWAWDEINGWQYGRGFPDTLSRLINIGGSANDITAESLPYVDPSQVLVYLIQPAITNTGAVTLSIAGAAAKPVLDFGGTALAPGAIVADQFIMLVDNGDEYRLLLPALAVATFDHKGTYAALTVYSEGQVVTGSDGKWYQLKDPSATGDDPVGSVTGAWLEILAAADVADGAVTTDKVANDAITPPKLSPSTLALINRDFATVAAIQGMADPTKLPKVGLCADGREGDFVWKTGDYTSRVAADPYNAFYIKNDNVAASDGAYVRAWGGHRPPVTWAGVLMDNTGDQSARVQSLLDLHGSIFIPKGTMRCTSAIRYNNNNYIQFESTAAELHADHSGSGIIGKLGTSERRLFVTIESGMIYGAGSYGVDMLSTSYGKLLGTRIYQCSFGWRNGGAGSQGAFYNEGYGLVITSVSVGIVNGTLGNEVKVFGSRVGDCTTGTEDNDNSSVLYDGVAIEGFTGYGGRVSNGGSVSEKIRHQNCRFENPSTSGTFASAVAINWSAQSRKCRARDCSIIQVATGIVDSGTDNQVLGNS